jgi:hypothetical protein
VTFAGGRGFVTYRDLGGADADTIQRLVPEALAHYQADPENSRVEWKTRGHDHAPGLHEALLENGFVPGEPESIMLGESRVLAVDVELPDGVTLRRVTQEPDVRAMSAMQGEVFGDPVSDETANALLRRLSSDDGMELWVAGPWDLSRPDGRAGPISARYGQEAHQQRLDGVLAPDPPTFRSREGIDDDSLHLATLSAARSPRSYGLRQGCLPGPG